MQNLIIWLWFYRTFALVWFCEPAHYSINIDPVAISLNRFASYTCHCLWQYGIAELWTIQENIWPLQGLLILTDINDPFKTNSGGSCLKPTPCFKRTPARVPRVSAWYKFDRIHKCRNPKGRNQCCVIRYCITLGLTKRGFLYLPTPTQLDFVI